jgi:hypothetical protein
MKHAIYALLALCLVLSASPYAKAQSAGLIITSPTTGKKIQVATRDLWDSNRFDFWKAKTLCSKLGTGWRLPTKDELEVMYKELHLKDKGDFRTDDEYWSGTEDDYVFAYTFYFANGTAYYSKIEYAKNYVRAVRDLK